MAGSDIRAAQELSELIGLIYDSALEQNQWERLLQKICEMFPGHMALTGTFDGGHFLGGYSPSGFMTEKFKSMYEARWDEGHFIGDQTAYADERAAALRRDPPTLGRVRSSRDWYSDEEYRNTAFNKIFMKPVRTGHWTTLVFALNGTRLAALMFFENEEEKLEKDFVGLRQLLELISPHVVRATRIARALYMAKEVAETYKGFLDAIAIPLLISDSGRTLQMANSAGQRLLDRGDIFRLSQTGSLSLVDAHDFNAFRKILLDVEIDNDARGLRLEQADGVVSLCVAPFHPSMVTHLQAEKDVFDKDQLLAIFVGAHGTHSINPGLLQDVFQLTPREATICNALASGQTPVQISSELGRAEKTIRNQIQSVYDKVGVASNRELSDALSVFRAVGAMFDSEDPYLFGEQPPHIT
ncbi:helix-turn-helix transcriptional regulator [Aliiroseovarius sp. F20344]|uniref:helix-turn-helix transcriptional regulator n=1 Tax=Aliiroseovarius sp. F20344 TaxID=2926414 RepID=UPI001FF1CA34|nr:helix-turn-helix transcriptional regulator [Aliiroseovarius sp. F20344]